MTRSSVQPVRGFTLIELMIVLGILLVLAGIGVGVTRSMSKSMAASSAENEVSSALAEARMLAISRSTRAAVFFWQDQTRAPTDLVANRQIQSGDGYGPTYYAVAISSELGNRYVAHGDGGPRRLSGEATVRAPFNTTSTSLRGYQLNRVLDNPANGGNTWEAPDPATYDSNTNKIGSLPSNVTPQRMAFAVVFEPDGSLHRDDQDLSLDMNGNGFTNILHTGEHGLVTEPGDLEFVSKSSLCAVFPQSALVEHRSTFLPGNWTLELENEWVRANGRFVLINRYTGTVLKEQ